MRLFNGKKVANKILRDLKAEINKKKIQPNLAVVLVGNDQPSKIYVGLKKEAGKKIGIKVEVYKFNAHDKEEKVIKKIKELNNDKKISGIIVQLPLPLHFNKNKITSAINPLKDVDGFHQVNQQLLKKGRPKFVPPLPAAILLAIKEAFYYYRHSELVSESVTTRCRNKFGMTNRPVPLKGKKAFALVNSETFGNILKMILKKEGLKFDYLIRKVCMISGSEEELEHGRLPCSRHVRIASFQLAMQQEADILITACGCPNLVGKEMIKKGAIVIDAGITRYHNKRVVGDVNRKDIRKKADFLTPVPNGIGPVAVALLLKNVYLAVKK